MNAILLVLAALAAAAPMLEAYKGNVQLERAGLRRSLSSAPEQLGLGDKLHTGRGAEATLKMPDGSTVRLGPGSVFAVQEAGERKVSIFLQAGKLWASVVKRKLRTFEVRTPVAVCAVRGTEFSVEAMEGRRSAIEVFEGSVAVLGSGGDEVLLTAGRRVEVLEGRLERPERIERHEKRREERKEKMKARLEREVGHQLAREGIERAAATDQRNALYQEGRTMIDAFGKRVRVEEYLTRPDPASFRYVTLNFRDGRTDRGVFEVTANRALPRDLGSVNLWFSPSAAQPAFWAVKQRWTLSNGLDSAVQLAVDGVSRPITFLGEPIYDPGTNTFSQNQVTAAHATVFGNVYEFLNGDAAQIHNIWTTALRPLNGPGMMWHMIPVKMNINRAADDVTLASFWDYGFATRVAPVVGGTGKMFIDKSFAPNPGLAHFVEDRRYIDFVDADGNGVLNFDEPVIASGSGGNPFGVNVYQDKATRLDAGGNEVAFAGAGARNAAGDTVFFSDANNNGANDDPFSYTLAGNGPEPGLFTFAASRAREWSTTDTLVINDKGEVFDFRSQFGEANSTEDQGAAVFQRLSFERVLRSSRFQGRKIDVVMTPRMLLRAGLVDTRPQHEGVEGPGPD